MMTSVLTVIAIVLLGGAVKTGISAVNSSRNYRREKAKEDMYKKRLIAISNAYSEEVEK